ncbi:MAG: efflux RND transporter periplasmic adaptor subunit [Pseudomonadota bacterium]
MGGRVFVGICLVGLGILVVAGTCGAQESKLPEKWKAGVPAAEETTADRPPAASLQIEATIINPHKSANVSAQIAGLIKDIAFQEGERVEKDQVVVKIDDARYADMTQKVKEKLAGLQVELKKATTEAKIQEDLFELKATTRQELNGKKSDAEVIQARVRETEKDLALAQRDQDSCQVKAPFTGYLAVRYKQPDEVVDRLENLFSIVDSSKVYAVANVDEGMLIKFEKGAKATFVHKGRKFEGQIERVGSLIDPKSKTKKVYCLIDNSNADLQVGMTGSLQRLER